MKNLHIILLFATFQGVAQVGINNTNPDPSAILDVAATDKGVLAPRVSLPNANTTSLDGTNTAANGLLIYNTNASVVGGSGIGFYTFNGTIWEKITTTADGGSDADFYEVGTTAAPDDITDDIFTLGNVGVGKITADYPLDVQSNGTTAAFINMDGTDNGFKAGITNNIVNSGSGIHHGVFNFLSGIGNNEKSGVYNSFASNARGSLIGIHNNIVNTIGTGEPRIGVENYISSNSSGLQQGIKNTLINNGIGRAIGVDTSIEGFNVGHLYGSRINITGSGSTKYGVLIDIDETSNGVHYGIFSKVLRSNSYAAFFQGRVTIGSTPFNNYIFPLTRGTNNQIMQTDGSGNVNWVDPETITQNRWSTAGNAGTNNATNFIGTTDNVELTFRTNNTQQWRVSTKGQWESLQNRGAIYIGENAGENDLSASASFDVNARIFIGKNAGMNNTTGISNLAIGPNALSSNTDGAQNIAIGTRALELSKGDNNIAIGTFTLDASTGDSNTAVGNLSLSNTNSGEHNTALGYFSGVSNTSGSFNSFLGYQAGRYNTTGSRNFYGGASSGWNNDTGSGNVMIGNSAGTLLTSSQENVIVGYQAMSGTTTREGNQNTILGRFAGFNAATNNSVFIGYRAGQGITEDNRLEIETTLANPPLIYGEFDNDILRTNAEFQINNPLTAGNSALLKNDNRYSHSTDNNLNFGNGSDYFLLASEEGSGETGGIRGDGNNLAVWSPADGNRLIRFLDEDFWNDNNGSPYDNGAERAYIDPAGQYFQVSDRNKKDNIKAIAETSALLKISKLNGYTYTFKQSAADRSKGNSVIESAGLLAQELLAEIPESVSKNEGDDYLVNYQAVIPYMVEAIKELKNQLMFQQKEMETLKNKLLSSKTD